MKRASYEAPPYTASCHFVPLWYKYSRRCPVPKHPQSMLFP